MVWSPQSVLNPRKEPGSGKTCATLHPSLRIRSIKSTDLQIEAKMAKLELLDQQPEPEPEPNNKKQKLKGNNRGSTRLFVFVDYLFLLIFFGFLFFVLFKIILV
ncbi:hypothetical protein PanWU01x14_001630 [Parasponia andersonii]|uniref:Transmembrane protein n=1 Tax=Parasponia andersonii TaxID=3476 RepID=A0A2P5E4X3_PARAD|nr:hypothetical protein PanWU01x14_001630 [Parasponia andersonii]